MRSFILVSCFLFSTASASPLQLSHSGRILAANGAPVTGTVDLDIDVYVAGDSTPTHPNAFDDYVLDNGFYSVLLNVDSTTFLQSTEVLVQVNNAAIGPRQPLVTVPNAAVAELGRRVSVSPTMPSGDCGDEGTITWGRDVQALFVCADSGDWIAAGGSGDGDGDGGGDVAPGNFDVASTGETTFTVPDGVTSMTVRAWGGGGSGGANINSFGGGGAYVTATVSVTPGEDLVLQVAQGGQGTTGSASSGAGASLVLRGTTPLVIAAGGGGGGSNGSYNTDRTGGAGGAGGGLVGEDGTDYLPLNGFNTYCEDADGGSGGTQSAGGAGGYAQTSRDETLCTSHNGSSLTGGRCNTGLAATGWQASSTTGNGRSGFGGAGYFGGGAGGGINGYCAAGGGGGSSYAEPGATNVSMVAGSGREPGEPTTGRGGDYFQRGSSGFNFINAADVPGEDGRIELSWGS